MDLYHSRLTPDDLDDLIIKYKIPHDLYPRQLSEEFLMFEFSDDTIVIYPRIFDFFGVQNPFSLFLLTLIKHYKVYFSHLGPLGLNKVITFEVLCRSLQIEPTGADGNVMGIHDFLCLPEWTMMRSRRSPILMILMLVPLSKILAKAEASQKRKASSSGAATIHVAKYTRSALAQSLGSTTQPSLFAGDDDESDDDDACMEIPLVTPLHSTAVIPSSRNQDSRGKDIMVDDVATPSGGVSQQRLSSGPAPLFRDVFGDAIHTDFFPFFAVQDQGKERKKKIKSLSKSMDNLHSEVARLSVTLNQATILEKFLASDEFSIFQGKLFSLAARAGFEHVLSMHQTKDDFAVVLKKMVNFMLGAQERLSKAFPLVAQTDYAFLNKIFEYATEPLSVILQLEPEKLSCLLMLSASFAVPLEQNKEQVSAAVDGSDLHMTYGAAHSKSQGVFVQGTSHVLDDVAEVTMVGRSVFPLALLMLLALFAGEKGDGSAPFSTVEEVVVPLSKTITSGSPHIPEKMFISYVRTHYKLLVFPSSLVVICSFHDVVVHRKYSPRRRGSPCLLLRPYAKVFVFQLFLPIRVSCVWGKCALLLISEGKNQILKYKVEGPSEFSFAPSTLLVALPFLLLLVSSIDGLVLIPTDTSWLRNSSFIVSSPVNTSAFRFKIFGRFVIRNLWNGTVASIISSLYILSSSVSETTACSRLMLLGKVDTAAEGLHKGNQDSRRRDVGYNGNKARDNGSDNEVKSCSKTCEESYARLKKLYDEQRDKLRDDSVEITAYTLELKKTLADDSDSKPVEYDSSDSNSSVETTISMHAPVDNAPKIVYEPKVWTDAPIIEEYESDSDDDLVFNVQENIEKPSFAFTDAVKHVKSHRENVKEIGTPNHYPKIEKQDRHSHTRKDLGYAFTRKSCFVCGFFSHLIRDCDFYEKRMVKQATLTISKKHVTCQKENRLVWNNVQRVNHQNKFVPSVVLTKTGKYQLMLLDKISLAQRNTFANHKVNTVNTSFISVKGNWDTVVKASFTMSNTHQELASPEANGFCKVLASPKQTALGKDISNPFMVGSLPKTICYKLLLFGLAKDAAVNLILLGFDQIVDFLNAHVIHYALMVNPTIYVSCIKQFSATIAIKKVNDVVKLRALIDGNAKRTAWNEFSCSMASAVICLAIGGYIQTRGRIGAIDADEEITLVEIETQAYLGAKLQGRKDDDNAAIKDASVVEPTVFDDEEVTMTMAQTLIKMKAKKARLLDEQMAKRLHDEEVEQAAIREKQEKDDLQKAKVLQQQYVDKQENIDWNLVIEQMQEKHLNNIKIYQSLKRKPISIAQARKNMIVYLKNMAGYKMEHFKGMTYDKESFKKLKAVKVSGSESTQDTLTIDPKEMSEEDVKNMLEIVLNIIKVGGIPEADKSFEDMLKGFDREYLDSLWRLVKEKFRTAVPTVNKEKALWVELKRLFEPDTKDVLWKLQRYMHYPLLWKLHSNCGVHQVSLTTRRRDMFMLTEKDYPLSNGVMTLMPSTKLQVKEDSEMARDLVMKIFMKANQLKSKSLDTSSK
uniref:Reverse transcriptase domain-containing protein n=1 Tax=Tanacetum cinerariifolium TaxID=118510 RepID=A0A699H100_TANCI|nr:hypothetical protein [Tanacetum cinerariifolium]